MKLCKSLIAIAVAAISSQSFVFAQESERVLTPVKSVADVDVEVQARTEIGRLNEYTPLAGSVVGREELDTVRFVDSFHELLPRVPGVSMSRNLRFTDGGKNYTENRVDGMRARNTGTYTFIDQVNSGDIERIEIIRGPGSVLSGSNAIGGTINVITRDPPAQREFEVTGEVMGDGGFRTGFTGGDRLSDSLGYFFNVNRLDKTGWRDHTDEQKDSFSTKWVWRPDSSSKLSLRYEYLHDNYQDPGSLTEAEFDDNWRQAQPKSFFLTDITYSTPSIHFKKLLGDFGEFNIFGQSRKTDSTAKTSVTGTINDVESTENNLQLMYKHNFSLAKTSITGGLDYLDTDSHTWNYKNNSATSFHFYKGALTGNSKSMETHQSPFMQIETSPFEPLRLTFGVRRDNLEYEVDNKIDNKKDGTVEYERTVKKFGALYELNKENFLWLNIAEGFMGPGVSTMIGSGGATPASHAAAVASKYIPASMSLKPEDSITKEIGIRGTLGFGLKYDTGYYQTEFKNLIVSSLCGPTELCYTRYENAAKAHASGFETSLEYELNQYIELGLSHTYAKYKYDDYVNVTTDYSGKNRYYTPKNHYNARVVVKPAAGWKIELEMDHIDAYYTNQSTTDSYKRPDIYNLRASYNAKSWGVWLHALNLLDTKYAERVGATDAGVRNTYSAGYTPLTLRAGFSYRF